MAEMTDQAAKRVWTIYRDESTGEWVEGPETDDVEVVPLADYAGLLSVAEELAEALREIAETRMAPSTLHDHRPLTNSARLARAALRRFDSFRGVSGG